MSSPEIPNKIVYVKEVREVDENGEAGRVSYFRFHPNNTYDVYTRNVGWEYLGDSGKKEYRIKAVGPDDKFFTWYDKHENREWYNEYIEEIDFMLEVI